VAQPVTASDDALAAKAGFNSSSTSSWGWAWWWVPLFGLVQECHEIFRMVFNKNWILVTCYPLQLNGTLHFIGSVWLLVCSFATTELRQLLCLQGCAPGQLSASAVLVVSGTQ
jgi:hypothetical protein